MSFIFNKTKLNDVILIEPNFFGDARGFFMESYKKSEFIKNGIGCEFVQDNHSKSIKGVLRGLHYQIAPNAQAKLVRCTKGSIYDVVVDLREESTTFGQWLKVELSEDNKKMLFIPEGFAHGFVVISDDAELLYKTNSEFSPEHDRGILWNDKEINIDWGISFEPILSKKDKTQSTFKEIVNKKEKLEN